MHQQSFFWDELDRIFKMSSTQAVANLHSNLEGMFFKEGGDWEKHLSGFLSILDDLGARNQAVDDFKKVTKFLRNLPASFDALSIYSSLGTNTFDEITN